MTWTTLQKNESLDALYGATRYFGISSTLPAADGSNVTEPSGANYSRVSSSGLMGAAAAGAKSNTSEIVWPVPSGAWTAAYLCVFDHPTAGDLRTFVDVTDRAIVSGDTVKVPVGGLVHSL